MDDVLIPWYRQFWPWFVILIPASTVVAGLTTWYIAARNPDSLVVDDYYKQGLAINQNLAREERAVQLGLQADLQATGESVELRIGPVDAVPETGLSLALHHPTRADLDRTLDLQRVQPGLYRAAIGQLADTRWTVTLMPPSGSWRLTGVLSTGPDGQMRLSLPASPATRK